MAKRNLRSGVGEIARWGRAPGGRSDDAVTLPSYQFILRSDGYVLLRGGTAGPWKKDVRFGVALEENKGKVGSLAKAVLTLPEWEAKMARLGMVKLSDSVPPAARPKVDPYGSNGPWGRGW